MNFSNPNTHAEVPTQVFREFLGALKRAEVPSEVIERLQTTIVEKRDLSEKTIRSAIFPLDKEDD